jgi:hypothetical protein
MRQDALMGSFCIHIHDGDEFIAACRARDDIEAGFVHAKNIR